MDRRRCRIHSSMVRSRFGGLAEAEVTLPASQVGCQFLAHLLQTDPLSPTREFPDFLLTAQQGLRRNAPFRLLVPAETEPQEFPRSRSCHRTLGLVPLELEPSRDEARDVRHHSLSRPRAAAGTMKTVRSSLPSLSAFPRQGSGSAPASLFAKEKPLPSGRGFAVAKLAIYCF
jgi:hypothetical protein